MIKGLILLSLLSTSLFAQKSPFNQLEVQIEDEHNFTFFVGGHFHGASNDQSGFPAATLLANLEQINSAQPSFIISLGDLFLSAPKELDNYNKFLFSQLKTPLFNTVGNHDIEDIDYESKFGNRLLSFTIGESTFLILDTEIDNGDIEDEQLELLKSCLTDDSQNLFIFAHRPIWAEYHEELNDVFKGNTSNGTNFEEIYPLLKKSKKQVYMFGGSLGGEAPVSFFYHKPADNIHYIATAIRNLPRDGILSVAIINDDVQFKPISFTGQKLNALETYNLAFWSSNTVDKSFNWRLLPLYIKQMLMSWMFWVGVLLTLAGGGVTYLIVRRMRRKKMAQ